MFTPSNTARHAIKGTTVVQTVEGLAQIESDDYAGVLWARPDPLSFSEWLNDLDPDLLPTGRVIIPAGSVMETLVEICDESGTPDCPERGALIADMALIAQRFIALTRTPYVRIRLDRVQTNACKKFHIDYLITRLICTYRGTGTEYGALHQGGDPTVIATVPTGAPFVMRGKQWENAATDYLRHRSPPIEGKGETRLVFVLDPIEEEALDIEL